MSSSLFPDTNQNNNSIFGLISNIKNAANGDVGGLFNNLQNTNPQFAQFVQQNQGKSPEQIAAAYGLDYNAIKRFI